jgi:hypothetical protein
MQLGWSFDRESDARWGINLDWVAEAKCELK